MPHLLEVIPLHLRDELDRARGVDYDIQLQAWGATPASEYIISDDAAEFIEKHRWFRSRVATPEEVESTPHAETLEYIDFYSPGEEPWADPWADTDLSDDDDLTLFTRRHA